jgi:magnesium transporter
MLATRTTTGIELLLPSAVRLHEMPVYAETARYAPALSFHQQVTAQQATEALRQMQSDVDHIYYLFVTDSSERLVGVVTLRQLICVAPGARLFEFMDRRVISLPYDATLEEQARLMSDAGLLALPVVDEKGRLVGAMDASDLIGALREESTTEMYHLAGLNQDETLERRTTTAAGYRAFWLLSSLVAAFVGAWLISALSSLSGGVASLAVFIPLVVMLGMLAGRQSLTFVAHSLLLGQVRHYRARDVMGREMGASLINGLLIGGTAGLLGWLWQGQVMLGIVAGIAVLGTLLLAALAGAGVPLACKKLDINPARASALLVNAIASLGGLALLFGLGVVLL